MFENEFTNVDYDIINKQINGEPLYYTTGQVADILGTTDSKLRYYTKVFEDLLNIEISNRNRRYKKSDIAKLKFIIELTDEGLSLNQIKEYCSEKNINDLQKDMIVKDNPLQIQVFMKALTEEFDKMLDIKLNEHLRQFKLQQELINQSLQEQINITVDEIVTDKLDDKLDEFKNLLREKEDEAKNRDTELIDMLRKNQEDRLKEIQKLDKQRGFFSKLFNRQ